MRPSGTPNPPRNTDATGNLLAALWERNLPLLRERCAQLDQAVLAVRTGTFTLLLHQQALETAHKLAGTLGMFGYSEGTNCARRIEQQLESELPIDPQSLSENVAALCNALPL